MSIASEIQRIQTNIENAYLACQTMGATMPQVHNSANLADCIDSIQIGPSTKQRLVSVADNLDNNKLVLYTDDGENWDTATMPNTRNWGFPFYGNGKFIVTLFNPTAGQSQGIYAISEDGINWTEHTFNIPTGTAHSGWSFCKGVYGNGKYVLVYSVGGSYAGSGGQTFIFYSSDALNWSNFNLSFNNQLHQPLDIIFDGEKFVILSADGHVAVSTDAINWTQKSNFESSMPVYSRFTYSNTLTYNPSTSTYSIAIGYYSGSATKEQRVYTTTDLDGTWAKTSLSYSNVLPCASCIINNEVKFFCGWTSLTTQSAGYINLASDNTATFVGSSVPRLNYHGGAGVINGIAVVIAYGSDKYIYSTDGSTWTEGTLPASSGWWGSCVGEVDQND